jgi:sporulation protein YlmC with PRC-barrel domain
MKPDGPIKLVSQLLDLPLLDSDGRFCGIVDDVDLAGAPGRELGLKALLVGPGAYRGRMPAWAMALVKLIGGDRLTRVSMDKVRTIGSVVHLKCPARDLGLDKIETEAARWMPHKGAL